MAHALSYMHHDCTPPIIHRDGTSSNVLLNSQLEAVVSDFGTARFIYLDSSNQTLVACTYGHIAPVKIALACLCSKPKLGPSMQQVANKLSNFKLSSLSSPFHEISIHHLMTREISVLHPSVRRIQSGKQKK
ncbi:hypothetical protein VNO78_25406 [Psophocarpus tetragonolobus]|uniref:non-specific serine/threonine protein kinase n=1 Tax=Psophocarpus tetragonolobus TaxID=3891 RepID=A0AAN9S6G7_PSOTE